MIALALAVAAALSPGGVDLLFPNGKDIVRVRVEVTVNGLSPELGWAAFLDELHAHFDRDGDGVLSAAEAGRVFPLPLPGGREARTDFASLDADKDGKATRAELRAFYRAAGFAPVVAVVRPPDAESRRLSGAVFRHLDRDADGTLTRAELGKAPALLRRLDDNEDEVLTAAELLSLEADAKPHAGEAVVKVGAVGAAAPLAVVRIDLGKRGAPAGAGTPLRVSGAFVTAASVAWDANQFRAAKGFYLAQFRDAAGAKRSLTKTSLQQDDGLAVLAAAFDPADRNGDGTLTAAELTPFLDLVELGVGCQAVVSVEDRGPDLFAVIDADTDGRLDLAELNAAALALAAAAGLPVRREDVPRQFRVSVGRGPVGPAFGPVPIPAVAAPKQAARAAVARGPRWFGAMDRNGDGFVSPAEFVGPPELFRKLDADADGRVSPEEAARHEPG